MTKPLKRWSWGGCAAWCGCAIMIAACLTGSTWAAEAAAPPTVDADTVALLHFDEMKGEVAGDASGNNYHARFDKWPGNPEWYRHGRFGGCLVFDGINTDGAGDGKGDADCLFWMKGATPDPAWPGFTVEMWVRHMHLKGWQIYMVNSGGYGFVAKKDRLYSGLKPAGLDWVEVLSKPCLKVNVWQHIALTYDREAVRLYCDGVEVGKSPVAGKPPRGSERTIFGHDSDLRPSQIRGVCGMIDEVRVSKVARTRFPKGPYKPKDRLSGFNVSRGPKGFIEPEPVVRDVSVKGVVFEDGNANGKRDRGEQGISGVWVTDGGRIKDSGGDGGYVFQFKAEEYRLIYITLPNGYKATGPWYHLIGQDEKKTAYEFDFALQRDPAALDRDYAFLVTADSQFSTEREGRMLKADMAQITQCTGNPRFHFIVGDLTMTGWLNEWKWYVEAIAELTMPCYNVYGGHGGNYGRDTRLKKASVHHFNQFVGPTYYSWNYGGRHFVCHNNWGGLSAAGRARQEAWMKADLGRLKSGAEVIYLAHTPGTIWKWRKDLKQVVCFHGHWHENNLFYHQGLPVLCTVCIRGRDWGAMTRTVRYCEFKDGKLITELRPTGQYKRVEIINPPAGGAVLQGTVPLRVLAFDTTARVKSVTVEVDGEKMALEKLGQFTWGADLDTSRMAAGKHAVSIAVTDDRPESWPLEKSTFSLEARPVVRCAPGEDWPMLFKSLKDLRTTRHEVTPPLDLAWSVATGGQNQLVVTPIVYQGRVYMGIDNMNVGQIEPSVQCFDAATGRLVWRTTVDTPIRLSLAADQGRVFAQTNGGWAYGLDARTGKVLWRGRISPEKPLPYASKCAVIVDRGKVITFGEYGFITIFDAQTGKKVASWTHKGARRVYYGGPFPDGDRLWLAGLTEANACDMMTGKTIWTAKTQDLCSRGTAMGIVQDGVYYVRGYRGIAAFDRADGKRLWHLYSHTAGAVPVPTIADGVVYAGGNDLMALEARTGKKLWGYQTFQAPDKRNQRQTFGGASSPLVSGKWLYVGRDDGAIIALDKGTGRLAWRFGLGVPVKSSPVVSGNMLFVSDFDGNLHAFASRTR